MPWPLVTLLCVCSALIAWYARGWLTPTLEPARLPRFEKQTVGPHRCDRCHELMEHKMPRQANGSRLCVRCKAAQIVA